MNRNLLFIGVLALAAASQASALTLTFDDRGNWTSQVTSLVNFNSCGTPPCAATNFGSGGLVYGDLQVLGFVVITEPFNTGYGLNRTTASAPWFQWGLGGTGAGSILYTDNKLASNTVFARLNFANPVSAFGFNFGAGGNSGAPGSVTIAPAGFAPINVTTAQGPTFSFWGLVSDSQTFTTVDIFINSDNRYLVLDDIAQGTFNSGPPPPGPEEVAEPGTILQLAMGGLLLAFARRRFGSSEGHAI